MSTITIPGALADHLTTQTIADADTVAALDGARRGRGRTLVIEPTSTRVLHVISAYAEALLENRSMYTAAQARAARLWIQRAGHSVPAPAAAEQAPAPVRDEPSDWWTIMDPATGEEIARVHGETYQEMTPRAEALPEVRAVIRRHKGFSRRRLPVSELTPEQRAQQAEAAVEQAAPANAFEQGAAGLLADRVDLAETVICPTCHVAKGARCLTRAGKPARETHGRRVEALEQAAGITAHRATARREAQARGYTSHGHDHKAEAALLAAYAARISNRATLDGDQALAAEARLDQVEAEVDEQFGRAGRAADAVEYAEQVEARVETVEDAEALYAAQLITEADATDGTWRGAWIGEHQAADALFVVDQAEEQGALFDRAQ
ncbi:hypothetical protein [Streptomyces sp. CS090A]|uniref:hypothetical protein n=1 Tax=Streptomyces sp. CS090A TaxID=2162710 RepID=UPI0013A5791F|nr:hypothetical protein [Streptomyces sp. CS090A]